MDKISATAMLSMSTCPKDDEHDDDDDRTLPRTLQEALCLTMSLPMEKDNRRRMDIELIWSQIQLIYRAEGNANLVIALPQFSKILRLPKWQQIHSIEKDVSPTAEFSMSVDHGKGW